MESKKTQKVKANAKPTPKKVGVKSTKIKDEGQFFWIVYYRDDGSADGYNVLYSDLVLARSEYGAIAAIAKDDHVRRTLGAHQVELIVAQDKDIEYDPDDFRSLSEEENEEDEES